MFNLILDAKRNYEWLATDAALDEDPNQREWVKVFATFDEAVAAAIESGHPETMEIENQENPIDFVYVWVKEKNQFELCPIDADLPEGVEQ